MFGTICLSFVHYKVKGFLRHLYGVWDHLPVICPLQNERFFKLFVLCLGPSAWFCFPLWPCPGSVPGSAWTFLSCSCVALSWLCSWVCPGLFCPVLSCSCVALPGSCPVPVWPCPGSVLLGFALPSPWPSGAPNGCQKTRSKNPKLIWALDFLVAATVSFP